MFTIPVFAKRIIQYYVDLPKSDVGRPRNNSTAECIDYIYTLLREVSYVHGVATKST